MEKPKQTERGKQHREYCTGWISKIAAAANVELTAETISVYLERLERLSPEQMEEAGRRTIDEWDRPSMMPPLKFILDRSGSNSQLEAEQAWELVRRLIRRDWYADGIGWVGGADKKLTPAMRYAIRQCGGEHKISYATDKDFSFLRRDFLQAHERFQVEGGEQVRLTQTEAAGLLNSLRRELPE